MPSDSWQKILIEFLSFGGIAENIEIRNGNYGRGIFPLNPNLPSKISVPESLLINSNDLYIKSKEIKIKDSFEYNQEKKEFIENYLKYISFDFNVWQEINAFEDGLRKLPVEVIKLLEQLGVLNLKIRHKNEWENIIFNNFIQSRFVDYKGAKCLAPIFELVNHSPNYPIFTTDLGVSTSRSNGDQEFLHSYSKGNDPIRMLLGYGFCSKEHFAFSFPISINVSGSNKVIRVKGGSGIEGLIPIEERNNELILNYLPLGNKFDPTFPFRQLSASLKPFSTYQAREILNKAFTSNQEQICNLLLLLEGSDNKISSLLKKTLCYQLSSMAYYW